MKTHVKNHRRAFSLIELLIVITIIGILVVAFLPSITQGPSRARDVQRSSDLADAALALELYYQDNGSYPVAGGGADLDAISELADYFDNGEIPSDPVIGRLNILASAGSYYYESCELEQEYLLAANTENIRSTDGYYDMSGYASLTPCDGASLPFGSSGDAEDDNMYVIIKN